LREIKITFIFKSFLIGFCLSSVAAVFLFYFSNVSLHGTLFIVGLFSFIALVNGIITVAKARKKNVD
jgi:hypothetical protein